MAEKVPRLMSEVDNEDEAERHKLRVRLVDAIHEQCRSLKTRCVLFVSGGAALAAGWLLGRPGASSWIVEVRVPYGRNSLRELFHPEKLPGTVSLA